MHTRTGDAAKEYDTDERCAQFRASEKILGDARGKGALCRKSECDDDQTPGGDMYA